VKTFILREVEHAQAMVAYVKANAGPASISGKPLVVTIDTYAAKRSNDQNRLLHVILNTISEQAVVDGKQYSMETWKEQIRRRFIGTEELELPDGSRIERGISTTALSVGEFANLIEAVSAWAQTELNVDL
jgi:hypothetical protein